MLFQQAKVGKMSVPWGGGACVLLPSPG